MEIEKVRAEKIKAQEAIVRIIEILERQTGCHVDDLSFSRDDYSSYSIIDVQIRLLA